MKRWTIRVAALAIPAALAAGIGFRLAGASRGPTGPARVSLMELAAVPSVLKRFETKQRVVRDVIAGRRSLLEAAAAFKALDDAGPPCPGWVTLEPPPGVSVDENYCRMVIKWVRVIAPDERGDEAACPLEAELHDRLRDGTLQLPQP